MDIATLRAAYEGFEDAAAFPDPAAVERYREAAIAKTEEAAAALARRLPHGSNALEVGCGNGRLLIALARDGAIAGGLGVDLASSRIDFARRWAADERLPGLRFEAADVLEHELPEAAFDAAFCLTGAIAYFDAIAPGLAARLLERLRSTLVPGGLLVLELYPHPGIERLVSMAGGEARLWQELPAEDPWRFYLSRYVLQDRVLMHEKIFVHRETGAIDEGRGERLRLYGPGELEGLLEEAGFRDIELRADWNGRPYVGGELLVVFATSS